MNLHTGNQLYNGSQLELNMPIIIKLLSLPFTLLQYRILLYQFWTHNGRILAKKTGSGIVNISKESDIETFLHNPSDITLSNS